MTENDMKDAREAGQVAGRQSNSTAADCPYQHRSPKLRSAWLQGFSEGRVLLRQSDGASPVQPKPAGNVN